MPTAPSVTWFDSETLATADLTKVGAYRYSECPDFRMQMAQYSFDLEDTVHVWWNTDDESVAPLPALLDALEECAGMPESLPSSFSEQANDPELIELALGIIKYMGAALPRLDLIVSPEMPDDLWEALHDPNNIVRIHNASFDIQALRRDQGILIPTHRVECTAAMARSAAFPGGLDMLCQIFNIEEGKMPDGKRLIKRFCIPAAANAAIRKEGRSFYEWYDYPDDFAKFIAYAFWDIPAMIAVFNRLPQFNYQKSQDEYETWLVDQAINDRGIYLDREYAAAVARLKDEEEARMHAECNELTGGAVPKLTQRQALLDHLNDRYGLGLPNMQKHTLLGMLEPNLVDEYTLPVHLPPKARRLMELRLAANKTSLSKFSAALSRVSEDGYLRGMFIYCGAPRTGRWAGVGVQLQNLVSRHKFSQADIDRFVMLAKAGMAHEMFDDITAIGSAGVRAMFITHKGRTFIIIDFSNIEGRALADLATEKKALSDFRAFDDGTGPDLYNVMAAMILGGTPDEIDGKQRNVFGKVPTLFCGYQGGVGAGISMGSIYGVDFGDYFEQIFATFPDQILDATEDNWDKWGKKRAKKAGTPEETWLAVEAIKVRWRMNNAQIVQLWHDVENTVRYCIANPGETMPINDKLRAKVAGFKGVRTLLIELPSKRKLVYYNIHIKHESKHDKKGTIHYYGVDNRQGSPTYGRWAAISTYGGKMVENITQAYARDVLALAMRRIHNAGYEQAAHVHDEIVVSVPDDKKSVTASLQEIVDLALMGEHWCRTLPLSVGQIGHKDGPVVSPCYRK